MLQESFTVRSLPSFVMHCSIFSLATYPHFQMHRKFWRPVFQSIFGQVLACCWCAWSWYSILIVAKKYVKIETELLKEGWSIRMKKKLLNAKKIERCCESCARGSIGEDDESIFCPKMGVMEKHSSCKKFIYDPLKRVPKKSPLLPEYTEKDFELWYFTDILYQSNSWHHYIYVIKFKCCGNP